MIRTILQKLGGGPSRDPRIKVFHHIPKCGGTALKQTLEEWFVVHHDMLTVAQLEGDEEIHPALTLDGFDSKDCLSGHFEIAANSLPNRYPGVIAAPERFLLFSMIRDPLELRKSLYYYEVKKGRREVNAQDLADYLLDKPNYLSRRFPCTEETMDQVLARYEFIGLQERMEESVTRLASVMGEKRRGSVPQLNLSPRDEQETEIDEGLVAEFRQRNALDYAIYAAVEKQWN